MGIVSTPLYKKILNENENKYDIITIDNNARITTINNSDWKTMCTDICYHEPKQIRYRSTCAYCGAPINDNGKCEYCGVGHQYLD